MPFNRLFDMHLYDFLIVKVAEMMKLVAVTW